VRFELCTRLAEPWSLTDLAERVDLGRYRLCRLFKHVTGATISAYVMELRLRSALERLEPARGDLTTLALDLGFASHSHFTYAFRRRFGRSPTSWMNRLAAS